MTDQVKGLLFEAHRRNDMLEQIKPIGKRWLGLGTEAAYRPAIAAGLMVFHDGQNPPPRCKGWLTLTPKGVKALKGLEPEFTERLDAWKRGGYERTLAAQYSLMGGLSRR